MNMTMRQVLNMAEDFHNITIYSNNRKITRGKWYEDNILEFVNRIAPVKAFFDCDTEISVYL